MLARRSAALSENDIDAQTGARSDRAESTASTCSGVDGAASVGALDGSWQGSGAGRSTGVYVAMAVEAMQNGAVDFIQKPFRDQDLIDRIQRALARDATNRQQLQQGDRIRDHLASLTPREQEVLKLLVSGKQNKVMAAEVGVSQRTVEIHRARVMEKMEANSVAQLVRMVIEQQASRSASA